MSPSVFFRTDLLRTFLPQEGTKNARVGTDLLRQISRWFWDFGKEKDAASLPPFVSFGLVVNHRPFVPSLISSTEPMDSSPPQPPPGADSQPPFSGGPGYTGYSGYALATVMAMNTAAPSRSGPFNSTY